MIDVLVIICLTIFALIGLIALLDLANIRKIKPPNRSNLLFKVLIVEVVTVCVGGFATIISKNISNAQKINVYEMTISTQQGIAKNIIALSIVNGIVKKGKILYVDNESSQSNEPINDKSPSDYFFNISKIDTIELGYNFFIQKPNESPNDIRIKFENQDLNNFESVQYKNKVIGTRLSEF